MLGKSRPTTYPELLHGSSRRGPPQVHVQPPEVLRRAHGPERRRVVLVRLVLVLLEVGEGPRRLERVRVGIHRVIFGTPHAKYTPQNAGRRSNRHTEFLVKRVNTKRIRTLAAPSELVLKPNVN